MIEIDGHDMKQILDALDEASATKRKPTVIVAHTKKGKGVSFMEDSNSFHGKGVTQEQLEKALQEINA